MVTDPPSIRVLHVDDEPGFGELVATHLERADGQLTVQTTTNSEDALELLDSTDVDCIVSDYDMPERNGIEFHRAVRDAQIDLPFILYTGKGTEEIASEAIAAGVSDYLEKETGTCQYEVLANRIRNLVEKQRWKEQVAETKYRTDLLLEYSSDYLFITDESGEITYVTPSVKRVLGYDPDEITGEHVFKYTHPNDVQKATEAFAGSLDRPGEEFTGEFRSKHADGGYRWLKLRGRNLLDEPAIGGILINGKDITTRKQHEVELCEVN